MKKVTMDLMCELDNAELEARGQTLSATMLAYDEVEERKREATKEFSEELKAKRGEMRRLSQVIRAKVESRPVECAVEFHVPQSGIKRVTRLDTGEFVRDESMSPYECQSNLFGPSLVPGAEPEAEGDAPKDDGGKRRAAKKLVN